MLRHILKRLIYFPISPPVFRTMVRTLRWARILPPAHKPISDDGTNVFISHPYSRIGDLVLLLPFLQSIREQFPDWKVDIAVGAQVSDLLLGIGGLRHVFGYVQPRVKTRFLQRYMRIFAVLSFYRKQVRIYHYDLAIAPRWGSVETYDSIYLAYLTGAPRRCGYSAS